MWLAAAILAGLCALGQQPQGVYRPGHGVTSPTVVARTDPQYSEEARIAMLTGTVRISLVVGEDGNIRDAHAVSPGLGLGLDEKAIEAVRTWRFHPGLKDGMPVPVSVNVEVNFRLLTERGAWALAGAVFDPPEGATRPLVSKAPYPPVYTATGETGSVVVSFDVNPNGIAENLQIEKSSGPAAESEVIAIVRGWQFQPGVKDGQPVSVRCTLEFAKPNAP